jgi:hypothetical protein
MFYAGTFVRSWDYGLGEVTVSGENPEVAFLGGPRTQVDGATLKRVPRRTFEREEANLNDIERWLDLRIYGTTSRPEVLKPRPPLDLERAMLEQAAGLPPPKNDHPRGVVWFISEDLSNDTFP